MTKLASGRAEIGGSSKDSINIRWHFSGLTSAAASVDQMSTNSFRSTSSPQSSSAESKPIVRGYRVRYQAIGSSVVQYSQLLDPSTVEYDINNLHEDTNYDVCVVRIDDDPATRREAAARALIHGTVGTAAAVSSTPTFVVSSGSAAFLTAACVKGTTAAGSLSLSVGSTFAAFLTLGFVVVLVFAAKWQHGRRLVKRTYASGDSESGSEGHDGLQMIERVETVRQLTDGRWRLSSAVPDDDHRLSVEYDNLPSSTVSAASRRTSSAMGSQCFDSPPPLWLAVYAVSDTHPEYGVLAGILSDSERAADASYAPENCQYADADSDVYGNGVIGQWMAEVGASCSERKDRGTVTDDEAWKEEEMSDWVSESDVRRTSSERVGGGTVTSFTSELTVALDLDDVITLMNNECALIIDSGELDNDDQS